MIDTILITNKIVDSEQLEELSRQFFRVKVLHVFEPKPDLEHLRLINRFSWLQQVLIDDDLFDIVEPVIHAPRERLSKYVYLNPPAPTAPEHYQTAPGGILFVPGNDTHVKMMLPLAEHFSKHHFVVIRGANADKYLEEYHEPFTTVPMRLFHSTQYRPRMLEIFREHGICALVLGADWPGENWRLCHLARRCGIPSICIQEGPQDFELEEGRHKQLRHADYIFLQGLSTLDHLDAVRFYLSGNSRLTAYHPIPLPEAPMVLINSNFTYGVFEEARDQWVADCVNACAQLSVDYFISKHPRDHGDLSKYKVVNSDAFKLPEQMAKCSVTISRFSQVVHEAMLSGRQVIYYNPHGEVKRVLTEDRTGGLFHAHDFESLVKALEIAIQPDFPNKAERDICNKLHCGPCDGREIERCVMGIAQVAHQHRLEQERFGETASCLQTRPPRPDSAPDSALGHGVANLLRCVLPEESVQRVRRMIRGK